MFRTMCRVLFPTLAALAPAALAQQPEQPVVVVEGREPVWLGYGQHTTGAAIDAPVDLDRYQICGEAGDRLWLLVQATFDRMDPYVVVLDPLGAPLTSQSCGDWCSLVIDVILPTTGIYTVLVSDAGNDETGSYVLAAERILPLLNPVPIRYGQPANGRIDHGADADWFVFAATINTQIRLTLTATYDRMDPRLVVFDAQGTEVATGGCNDWCSFNVDLRAPATGDYYVMVYDAGLDEAGSYQLGLHCLFGNCPPNPASAWRNLALALEGHQGFPAFWGTGTMLAGTAVGMELRKAPPSTSAFLVLGQTRIDLPFLGGTFVPAPEVVCSLAVDAQGTGRLSIPSWPAGVARGSSLFAQAWMLDVAGPQGLSASNAIAAITP